MPRITIRILGSQREALYEQVRNHLAAVGDLWLALESIHDYPAAERLSIEFAEDFRLMADLGWDPEDERQWVDLHMPSDDLTEVIRRLRDEALGGLRAEREEVSAVEGPKAGSYEAAHAACEDILAILAERHGGEIHVCRA